MFSLNYYFCCCCCYASMLMFYFSTLLLFWSQYWFNTVKFHRKYDVLNIWKVRCLNFSCLYVYSIQLLTTKCELFKTQNCVFKHKNQKHFVLWNTAFLVCKRFFAYRCSVRNLRAPENECLWKFTLRKFLSQLKWYTVPCVNKALSKTFS